MPITRKTLSAFDFSLATLVGLFGAAIALMQVEQGLWLDEFITLHRTLPGTKFGEFLNRLVALDYHPILYLGLIYLAQAAGITGIALLRSLNLLGVLLVFSAVVYGFRKKSISLSQALIVWILFMSSPILLLYLTELRTYFLLYAASIATSVLWYMLMRHIEQDRHLSRTMIAIWGACLAIFVNLHYFATIFGGLLTVTLLISLAARHLWSRMLAVAGVSMAAAAPALILGGIQVFVVPKPSVLPWYNADFNESVRMIIRMLASASGLNLAATAGAVISCLLILAKRNKWEELRTAIILLGVVGLFLVALLLANAVSPLLVDRYLFAAAGAVTVAVAVLAASSGATIWMPTAVSAIALVVQAQFFSWFANGIGETAWFPSARAVAQLKSECPASRIFAYPAYNHTNGLSDSVSQLRFNQISYGYYAKKLQFSYEDLLPGATVAAAGPCPSVIWIEHMRLFANANAESILSELQIRALGEVELKRYGGGVLMIVRASSGGTGN